MAAIFENMTSHQKPDSVNRCVFNQSIISQLLEEQSCQISSRSDLKGRDFLSFQERRPSNNEKNNKMIKDLRICQITY